MKNEIKLLVGAFIIALTYFIFDDSILLLAVAILWHSYQRTGETVNPDIPPPPPPKYDGKK